MQVVPKSNHEASEQRRYWCSDCGNAHAYNTRRGWAKHVKELGVEYRCQLPQSQPGPTSTKEYENAQVSSTNSTLTCGHRRKRKDDLAKHLSITHGIPTEQALALAGGYKTGDEKRFWSCAFCVQLFPNINKRLRHIETVHPSNKFGPDEMSFTNDIKGLLLQPQVQEEWANLLEGYHALTWRTTVWEKTPATMNLRDRLQTGPTASRSAHGLAHEAYHLSMAVARPTDVSTPLALQSFSPTGSSAVQATPFSFDSQSLYGDPLSSDGSWTSFMDFGDDD